MTTTRKTAPLAARTGAAQPSTLFEQALQAEHARHAARIAELKNLEGKLRMLDAFMPAIRAAGINLNGSELHGWGGKAIHVMSATLNPQRNAAVERVLRDVGMRELRRADYSTCYSVELRKGHLTVAMTVDTYKRPTAQGAAKCD